MTDTSSNSSSAWKDRPTPARARFVVDQDVTSWPSSVTCPSATFAKPVTASMNEVLPAPLGPIRPVMRPGRTTRSTALTATVPP